MKAKNVNSPWIKKGIKNHQERNRTFIKTF